MPRLPDWTAVSAPAIRESGRPAGNVQTNALEGGYNALAKGVRSLGNSLGQMALTDINQEKNINTAQADAYLLNSKNSYDEERKNNPDKYADWDSEAKKRISSSMEEAAKLIKDQNARELWKAKRSVTAERWVAGVKNEAWTRGRDEYVGFNQKHIEDFRNKALDPKTSEPDKVMYMDTVKRMYDDMFERGYISKTQAETAKKNWADGYAIKKYEMMPPKERVAALASAKYATPNLASSISTAAKTLGISPVDLATVISYETGGTFDPWKAGPTTQWGQHRGLIQWGEPQRKKYGVTEGMPVEKQMEAVVRYLKDAGVKPGMGLLDVYSAVNAGRVGRYNASDANNGGAPGTVADKVRDQMEGHKRKASALLGGKSFDPMLERIAPDVREKMLRRAERESRAEDNAERVKVRAFVTSAARDANAAYLNGVPDFQGAPTKDQFMTAYGPEIGAREFEKLEKNKDAAEHIANFKGMPSSEIAGVVQEAAKLPAGPGYIDQARRATAIQKAAKHVIEARNNDPAAYVIASSPAVSEAYRAFSAEPDNPNALAAYSSVAMAEQARLGIANPTLMPKAEATAVSGSISSMAAKGEYVAAATAMQQLQTKWGEHWPTVFAQLASKGGIPGTLLVVGTMTAPTQIDSAKLLAEAAQNQDTLKKTIGSDDKREADKSVNETMKPFMDTMRLPNSGGTTAAFQNAVKLLAYQYIRGGESGDKAVKKAYNEIIEKKYGVMTKDYRVPIDVTDPYEVTNGADMAKSMIDKFKIDMPSGGSMFKGMRESDIQKAQIDHLKAYGRWHTLPDESGLVLTYRNGDPVMSGGSALTLTWDELRETYLNADTNAKSEVMRSKPQNKVGKMPMVGLPRINIGPNAK